MIPEGAIKKDWGWQKQVYSGEGHEVWLGHGTAGKCTSRHHHDWHDQFLRVLKGNVTIRVIEDGAFVEDHRLEEWEDRQAKVESRVQHSLYFNDDCDFIEIYRKVGQEDPPPVVEDTIRENAEEEAHRKVFAFG